MKVQVNGRNVEVNDYLRDYVTKKVGKLERYLPQITEVRAELTQNMTRSASDRYTSQITVWTNNGTESLYLFPRFVAPLEPADPRNGPLYATWYASGGTQGEKPDDPQMLRMLDLFRAASGQPAEQRVETAKEIWRIATDQAYSIGTVGLSPALMGVRIANNKLGNIPGRVCIAQHCRTPGGGHPETWYFKP